MDIGVSMMDIEGLSSCFGVHMGRDQSSGCG